MANLTISWDEVMKNPYIIPERDEQGVFYGYKVLVRKSDGKLYSPVYPVAWNEDGSLDADICPGDGNRNGIYFCKDGRDEELYYIYRHEESMIPFSHYIIDVLIVKCALSGIVIEAETGFRSEHAQIIVIEVINGNRKNSQNPHEYSQDNSRPDSEAWKYYPKGWGESPITRSPWDTSKPEWGAD